jgi:hypothetical protein
VSDRHDFLAGFRDPLDILDDPSLAVVEAVAAVFRDVPPPDGFETVLAERLDVLARSSEARLRMRVARRVGLPYSEVMARWSTEDLAAELAWDALESAEQWARCPNCGIDPGDVLDPDDLRPLEAGRWKLYLNSCHVCAELSAAQRALEATTGIADGTTWRLVPRDAGDPWIDDGGLLGPDDDDGDDW